MASAIDSGVDTGNDSNDSCVQGRTSKMEVDRSVFPTSSTKLVIRDFPRGDEQDEDPKIFNDLCGPYVPSQLSFVHLPSSLSHGYEVPPLPKNVPAGEYESGTFVRKIKARSAWAMRLTLKNSFVYPGKGCPCPARTKAHLRANTLQAQKSNISDSSRMCQTTIFNNVDAVKEMLEKGISPNCCDCFDRTPLHIAACMGYKEMVELLLSHGANPNAKDRIGNTPLHLAVCTNHIEHVEIIKLLLSAGTSVFERDVAGHSPLLLALGKFNIIARTKGPNQLRHIFEVIKILMSYMRSKRKCEVVNDEFLKMFENLMTEPKSKESLDSGVIDLLNNLSSLNISNNK